MRKALGALSRALNSWIPGALPDETFCGRACREFGSDSTLCIVLDTFVGGFFREPYHCLDEMIFALKGLRKK